MSSLGEQDGAGNGAVFVFKVAPENDPPIAVGDLVVRPPGRPVKVAVSELLVNDSDPEFDPLTLTGVSALSDRGAAVSLQGGWVFYEPTGSSGDLPDRFTYEVSDGKGGLATGEVVVRTEGDGAVTAAELRVVPGPGGTMVLQFLGIPNRWYAIQRAASLEAPVWLTLDTVRADATGWIRFTDLNPPADGAFYRAADMTTP